LHKIIKNEQYYMVDKNLIELYENSFKYNWDLQGLSDYSEKKTLYYKDLAREIARIHILLSEAQIKKGDKIALIGKNNIPWCVTYLAVVTYGAVIVPILQDFHADSIQHIVNHSESKLLFASTQIWESLDEYYLTAIRGVLCTNSFNISSLLGQ